MAACQTLFAILDSEQEKDEGKRVIDRAIMIRIPQCDVYLPAVAPALRNINLKFAGKTVALVGVPDRQINPRQSDHPFHDIDEGQYPDCFTTIHANTPGLST
ncbi:hypothetical protein KCP78_03470 [Salmonella enterica subsp. enterica]|nr:hypothetical protein KCP78_03470 [Salmonella enterica subsp. enterica]